MYELSGFIVDVAIQLTLVFWRPAANEEYVLYVLSGLWGMSDGIWETQINGLFTQTRTVLIAVFQLNWVSQFPIAKTWVIAKTVMTQFVSEMTYYVSSGTLNSTHSRTVMTV